MVLSSILWSLQRDVVGSNAISWGIRQVTPPGAEPVLLEDVKNHCRVDFCDDDTLLTGYVTAARQMIEQELSRALITQTWELGLNEFPRADRIRLPLGQLQSVNSMTYTDTGNNVNAMVAGRDYILNQFAEPSEVVLPFSQIWPPVVLTTAAPVRINFTCGYGIDGTAVPGPIYQAILMLIADWYANREDSTVGRGIVSVEMANGLDRLLTNYRLRNYTPYSR